MASTAGPGRRQRKDDGGMFDGSWMWIVLPVGILLLIAAVWFLIIEPAGSAPPRVTVTPPTAATEWPTVTPIVVTVPTKTPEDSLAPTEPGALAIGARIEVAGTGASQLRVRQLPGTDTITLKIVPDGTRMIIVDGPEEASGYTWWKVDDEAGMVGWAVADFLSPVQ